MFFLESSDDLQFNALFKSYFEQDLILENADNNTIISSSLDDDVYLTLTAIGNNFTSNTCTSADDACIKGIN